MLESASEVRQSNFGLVPDFGSDLYLTSTSASLPTSASAIFLSSRLWQLEVESMRGLPYSLLLSFFNRMIWQCHNEASWGLMAKAESKDRRWGRKPRRDWIRAKRTGIRGPKLDAWMHLLLFFLSCHLFFSSPVFFFLFVFALDGTREGEAINAFCQIQVTQMGMVQKSSIHIFGLVSKYPQ